MRSYHMMAQRLLRHRRPHVQFERVGSSSCHQASVARAHSWVLFAAMRPNARRAQPHHLRLLASARQNHGPRARRCKPSVPASRDAASWSAIPPAPTRNTSSDRGGGGGSGDSQAVGSIEPARAEHPGRPSNSKAMDQNGRPSKFGGPLSRENGKVNLWSKSWRPVTYPSHGTYAKLAT